MVACRAPLTSSARGGDRLVQLASDGHQSASSSDRSPTCRERSSPAPATQPADRLQPQGSTQPTSRHGPRYPPGAGAMACSARSPSCSGPFIGEQSTTCPQRLDVQPPTAELDPASSAKIGPRWLVANRSYPRLGSHQLSLTVQRTGACRPPAHPAPTFRWAMQLVVPKSGGARVPTLQGRPAGGRLRWPSWAASTTGDFRPPGRHPRSAAHRTGH